MNEPPNSRYFAANLSGQPIVWITRSSGFWTSQISFTPSSHCCGSSEPMPKWRIAAPVRWPGGALGEDGRLRDQVGAGLEVRELLAVAAAALVARADAHHLAVLDEQLVAARSHRGCRRRPPRPAPTASGRAAPPTSRGCRGSERRRGRLAAGSPASSSAAGRPCPCPPRRTSATRSRRGPGTARRIADGFIIAPESRCEPGPFPFSTSATGTSPSDSISASSSASSCMSRIAQASPPGPPPTITTPTSIRSSSGSVGAPTNSCGGVDRRRELDRGGGHQLSPSWPSRPR